MDHLPIPVDRQRPSRRVVAFAYFDIPFLGEVGEAGGDFYTYAVAHKIVNNDSDHSLNLDELEDLEDVDLYFARVQSWLYFGLVCDTFGSSVKFEDFIVVNASTGDRIINSAKLKDLMAEWHSRVSKMSKQARTADVERIKQSTTVGWRFCDRADHYGVSLKEQHMLVLSSIRILISSIWGMLRASDVRAGNLNEDYRISIDVIKWPRLPASYRPLAVLMAEYGWCPHEILRLLGTYHLTTVWTMTCLLRRIPAQLDHERCAGAIKCVARDVDPDDHQANHVTNSCNCEAVGPDIEQVKTILRGGGIPLIRCKISEDGRPSFKVVSAKGVKRHIAFSHVWADGMVIPKQNKIFRCQFLKLAFYLEKARVDVQTERLFAFLPLAPFLARHVFKGSQSFDIWLDIFCIPSILHADSQELRRQAIARIYYVFAAAEAVLIVDKSLTDVTDSDMPTTELMARVASSGWMTRCWTFSEMSLAQKSVALFCVGDRVIRYEDFKEDDKVFKGLDIPSRSLFRNLGDSAFIPFNIAWIASQAVVSEYVAFALIWNSLSARSTSWPGDVWGIMATLLGYSGKEIMTLQERDRLPAMMKELPNIPASFFFRDLPRSASAPAQMRWIPTRVQGIIRDGDGTFAFTDGGIVFPRTLNLKFLLSHTTTVPPSFSFEFRHEDLSARPDLLQIMFQISLHDHDAVAQHAGSNAQICILLPRNESQSGDSETAYISGLGCALLVTSIRADSTVETEFLSSLSYRFGTEKQTHHLQASLAGPNVVLRCDRQQWYHARLRRKKHTLAPEKFERILYFGVPAVLVFVMAATMVPLWIWYGVTHQPVNVQASLVLATCGFALFIVAVMMVVIFHENLLFRNWVDSFDLENDGQPKRWWKKIMPLW
ncbi:hypothetical protein G647_05031 [Cladophialophora carrionii CBS 160.54]|uniref:Heterokaryon incompatibility domain-containing protein n=1 Tax=Cladophialophora carrionii CBS 160.54 TaxID=1279043 RepID=V9DA98_9EURO|nr:uncharacterized protein G647_05031 [Cladophialophora carrionii CBS 160.54]ETI23233.1 hypothetical protein G647_05031 [Cladophialophora carrionii CBS 160.54]